MYNKRNSSDRENRLKKAFTFIPIGRLLLLFLFLSTTPAKAQFYNGMNINFGKNRVQWKTFEWSFYRQDKYDIYYYQGGRQLADYTNQYVVKQLPAFENKLGSHLEKKIQFIIFNSLSDFKQSNIDLEEEDNYNTGGTTHIVGTKIFLYFDGNHVNFERQIRKGIAQLLLNHIMNGNTVGSQMKNSYRYDVPDWFQKGLCSYLSDDWDSYKEEKLISGIKSGRYKRINILQNEDAVIAGHSFWNFIEEKYGSHAFQEILELTQSSQNIKKGLLYITGETYKNLMQQWCVFYQNRYAHLLIDKPTDEMKLKYKKFRTFTEPAISSDGKKIAYISNDEGVIRVWLEDLNSGKKKKLFKTGFRSDTYIDNSYPLLAWRPNSTILSFIIESQGKILFVNFDTESGKSSKEHLAEFQKITSFSYAHKENKIVLSASKDGKPDIFVYDLFLHTTEPITQDYYTDLSPVFSLDDKKIIFSSNRRNDTLQNSKSFVAQDDLFNLYSFDFKTKSPILQRITNQKLSNCIMPKAFLDGSLYYLNDTNGFFNLCEAIMDSAVSFIDTTVHYRHFINTRQITNFTSNIINYTYQPKNEKIIMLMPADQGEKLFWLKSGRANNEGVIKQISPLAQKRIAQAQKKQQKDEQKPAMTKRRFKANYRIKHNENDKTNFADTLSERDHLLTPADLERMSKNFGLSKGNKKDTTPSPNNYYVVLFFDKLISQIDFSYINYSYQTFSGGSSPIYLNSNFNIFLGTSLSDLMEDYKIDLGVKVNTSLLNNEYVIRLSDLRKRLDKSLTFHRLVTDNYTNYYYRTYSNELYYTLSYPFSEILSLKGTGIYRNDCKANLAIDAASLQEKNKFENWVGLRSELVYDNSIKIGTNLYTGARGKIFAEYSQLVSKETQNFIVFGFDYRNYQRIHRNFIWANRIAGSSSIGQSRLIYYMGGVDNWILAQFDDRTPIDKNQNYVYQTLATNMRGFRQNIRNGNSFAVINSELRFPVFSYFINQPINNAFIRNFQVIAFGDVGTAWTGWNPYDKSNSLYITYIENGALNISVTEQKEPIVGGIGFGLRTSLLGYFIRADVAWGIEDKVINTKPQFYFSLNLDF